MIFLDGVCEFSELSIGFGEFFEGSIEVMIVILFRFFSIAGRDFVLTGAMEDTR